MSFREMADVLAASNGEPVVLMDAYTRKGGGHVDVSGEKWGTVYHVHVRDESRAYTATHADPFVAIRRGLQYILTGEIA